jgi:hypothetical protein
MSARSLLLANAARLTVGAIALALYGVALATVGEPAPADTSLRFEPVPISAAPRTGDRKVRAVHPHYEHIQAWISSVGAAVALADVDGDGHANDVCLVDPRYDSVEVFPAPGTGDRYRRFRLPAPAEGFEPHTIAPMGCLPGDFDEDGLTDLLVYYWGRPPVLFMASSEAADRLRFRARSLVASREAWYTNAALQADFDGDGHIDLLFGNYFPEDARVLDPAAGDGGTMQRSMSRASNGGRNRLFLADQSNRAFSGFVDHSSAFTPAMANGWTLALATADLDGDLRPEIYVANDFGSDQLLVNLSRAGAPRFQLAVGRRTFATPRSRTLGRDSFKGMGAEFFDLNADGALDLAVSNIAQDYALLESHFLFVNRNRPRDLRAGVAPFVDESGPRGVARNGWGWDIKAADFDNDGRDELLQALGFVSGRIDRWPELQELAMANDALVESPAAWAAFSGDADLSGHETNRVYARAGSGMFRDVSAAAGLGERGVSRSIAVGDVDRDGRLDAVVARQWGRSSLLRNRTAEVGSWLSLDLRLPNPNGSSRPAIGAVARVLRAGAEPRVAFVDGGNGHGGKRAPLIHFGLGRYSAAMTVVVQWRTASGPHQRRFILKPGHHRLMLSDGGLT